MRNAECRFSSHFYGRRLEKLCDLLELARHVCLFYRLDGMYQNIHRSRQTRVLAYNHEVVVHTAQMTIPMLHYAIDSVNLKDPRFGFFEQIEVLLQRHDIHQGRVDIALGRKEQHAG